MFNFNTTHIFTGYIKELLSEFNLPKYRIYTKENQEYFDKNKKESPEIFETEEGEHARYIPYIKDDMLQKYVKNSETGEKEWEVIHPIYNFNRLTVNETRNLPLKNNIYDAQTHEYLGDFLRFIKDFKNIDLMPLYNCFSNQICTNVKLDINPDTDIKQYEFNSYDNKYKLYMLPVKFFKQYTIAIDCAQPVEMCCMMYSNYVDTREEFKYLAKNTYQKFNGLQFNKPILYKKLMVNDEESWILDKKYELLQNETNLKLVIKVPITNYSSVTVLEGDYLTYNDRIVCRDATSKIAGFNVKTNHTVTNFEDIENRFFFKPITNLQLLQMNTKTSYPFADRLIEYLIGQAITEEDPINDNVTRFQQIYKANVAQPKFTGIWEEKYKAVIYEYINKFKNKFEINHDILGYGDKEAEKYYATVADEEGNREIFATVDIYPEETEMVEKRAK